MNRKEWIGLAEYSLIRIKNSAHDLTKERDLDEFLKELKSVMEFTLVEVNT